MTILGEIVDLTHARNHPRFGAKTDWDEYGTEISQRLDAYGRSLQQMQQRTVESNIDTNDATMGTSPVSTKSMAQESVMHCRIVVTYGTYLMHTLHVLLNGKWDPISLLDDNDLWISSQSFVIATGHAVSAADALNEILELDPDLSFMPFFFGIYLLQGSFLLLLIADKLQGEASPNIVRACEVIVRAHEACIVTLNTEYQVCTDGRVEIRSSPQRVAFPGLTRTSVEKFPQHHAFCPTADAWKRHAGFRRTSPGDAKLVPVGRWDWARPMKRLYRYYHQRLYVIATALFQERQLVFGITVAFSVLK